jgi:hypothetical protein
MHRPPPSPLSTRTTRLGAIVVSLVGAFCLLAGNAVSAQAGKTGGSAAVKPSYPLRTTLTNDKIGHWAVVVRSG